MILLHIQIVSIVRFEKTYYIFSFYFLIHLILCSSESNLRTNIPIARVEFEPFDKVGPVICKNTPK
jgi:hypothetical protein